MLIEVKFGWAYALGLYAFTAVFHMTAVFAPVLLLWKYPLIGLAIAVLVVLNLKKFIRLLNERLKKIHDLDRRNFTPQRLIVIVKTYGYYFFKMFFPGVCAMTYPTLHFWGQTKEGNKDAYSFNIEFYKGCLAFVICIGIISYFINVQDYRILCFWVFMCLSLLQWCQIIAIFQDLADRYAGMATVFGMFFLSFFVHTYAGQYATAILGVFAGYYIAMLFIVMRMYRSEGARWEYQRHWFPQLPAPLKFENEYLIHDAKDFPRAWVLIQDYLKHGGRDFNILFQAAKCHQAVGRYEEAKKFAMEAAKNYLLYKENIQKKLVEDFLVHCRPPSGMIIGEKSRQVKRYEERKNKK
jgi:hypothetical protein